MVSFIVEFNKQNAKHARKFLELLPPLLAPIAQAEVLIMVAAPAASQLLPLLQRLAQTPLTPRYQVIYCAKRLSFNQQLRFAAARATRPYLWVLDAAIRYEAALGAQLAQSLAHHPADIIEFKPHFNGITRWAPRWRLALPAATAHALAHHPEIIAYTFPFLLNKVVARHLLVSVFRARWLSLKADASSNLSPELLYLILLQARSYCWLDQPAPLNLNEANIPLFRHVLSEWKRLEAAYTLAHRYAPELTYARAYYLLVVLAGLYGVKKLHLVFKDPQLICKKYYDWLTKVEPSKWQDFRTSNPYMSQPHPEVAYLAQLAPIAKWSKILAALQE